MIKFWTDDKVKTLAECCRMGLSFGVAAQRLGCTRNAAIGKALRCGFTQNAGAKTEHGRSQQIRVSQRANRKKPKPPRPIRVPFLIKRDGRSLPPEDIGPVSNPTEFDVARKILIESYSDPRPELASQDCRWPVGDPRVPGFGFCGLQQLAGSPYCPTHTHRHHHGSITVASRNPQPVQPLTQEAELENV